MGAELRKKARELLEEEMDKAPRVWEDCDYREECEKAAIRAIVRALNTTPPGYRLQPLNTCTTDENGCYTLPNGECVSNMKCMHSPDNTDAKCNCAEGHGAEHCTVHAPAGTLEKLDSSMQPESAEAMFHLRSYGDVSEKELLALTRPAARVSVSDEDIAKIDLWLLWREINRTTDDVYHAISRLMQAVKGEG